MKRLKSGKDWRVGWDSQADPFQGLVGGDNWSCELTAAEFDDFLRLLSDLGNTITAMKMDLMDQEAIAIDQQTDLIWMQISGYPEAYDLSFILTTGRRAEGHWENQATAEIVQALQTIKLF